jgi:hypothetical protein
MTLLQQRPAQPPLLILLLALPFVLPACDGVGSDEDVWDGVGIPCTPEQNCREDPSFSAAKDVWAGIWTGSAEKRTADSMSEGSESRTVPVDFRIEFGTGQEVKTIAFERDDRPGRRLFKQADLLTQDSLSVRLVEDSATVRYELETTDVGLRGHIEVRRESSTARRTTWSIEARRPER